MSVRCVRTLGAALAACCAVEFTYRLTSTGWSEGRLEDRHASVTVTASYLNDALGVFLQAIAALLDGAQHARCSWVQEPGESRWLFYRASSEVRLRLLGFRDAESPEPDDRGRLVFETAVPLRELAEAVASGAQKVLDDYGEDGYLELWAAEPFPVGHLQRIQAHLASE